MILETKPLLEKLMNFEDLTYDESGNLMNAMMRGELTNTQIASLLTALRMKGETATEIAGLSNSMQNLAFPIDQKPDALDVVGTGGASFKTFNVSSLSSLVLSSMGVKIAKHGNRSNTSKSGSADFLEGLGFNLRLDPTRASKIIDKFNFIYLFAPFYHRSMKHAITARKEMQIRTVFNILGPLTNPMGVKKQLIGVFSDKYLPIIAESLQHRGHERAAVIYNDRGADEILNFGTTRVAELVGNNINHYSVDISDFGLKPREPSLIRNRTVSDSIKIAIDVLGGERDAIAEFVAINSAMALRVNGLGDDLEDNTSRVLNHLATGDALDHVIELIEATGGRVSLALSKAIV